MAPTDHSNVRRDRAHPQPPDVIDEAEPPAEARWRELLTQISGEIAGPLTAALERVHALADTGRIDRQGLHALRQEIERAREAGLIGQQLPRMASGRLRQSHERLQLTQMLKAALKQRTRDLEARGVQLRQVLKPVEVIVDASLLSSLLDTLIDWSATHAQSTIEFRIDTRPWPAHARLTALFTNRAAGPLAERGADAVTPGLDSLAWRLLQQTAWTMGLNIDRRDEGATTLLSIEFPRTVNDALEGASSIEIDPGFAASTHSKPLAGNHVLVVAARRDLRAQVREAIRHMGLIIDFAGSIDEAGEFCRDGLPHAIVFEAALGGERFERLRDEIVAQAPAFAFIEIVEASSLFEVSGLASSGLARVGRDAIANSLPSALMFELTKGH